MNWWFSDCSEPRYSELDTLTVVSFDSEVRAIPKYAPKIFFAEVATTCK